MRYARREGGGHLGEAGWGGPRTIPGEGQPARGGPCAGFRVLDFGRYIAGPYCAALLAEHGADVVVRGGGEHFAGCSRSPRAGKGPVPAGEPEALSLTLDLDPGCGAPGGRRLMLRHRRRGGGEPAAPDAHRDLGLDYQSLVAVKPDVILTTTTAHARGGPYGNRWASARRCPGAVYLSGYSGAPRRAMVSWVDFETAVHAAFGTMAAASRQTGRGRWSLAARHRRCRSTTRRSSSRRCSRPTGSRPAAPVLGPGRRVPHAGRLDCLPGAGCASAVRALGQAHGGDLMGECTCVIILPAGTHGQVVKRCGRGARAGPRPCARGARPRLVFPAARAHAAAGATTSARWRFFQSIHYPGPPRPRPIARAATLQHTDAILAGDRLRRGGHSPSCDGRRWSEPDAAGQFPSERARTSPTTVSSRGQCPAAASRR